MGIRRGLRYLPSALISSPFMTLEPHLPSPQRASPLLERLESLGSSERIALRDAHGPALFRDVVERSQNLARQLIARGLGGSRIGLSSLPDRNWVEAFWAILLAGGSVVPISPLHPAPERA